MRGARAILAAATLVAFGQTGCAAVFRDRRPTVHVESEPAGGRVTMPALAASSSSPASTTPLDVAVPRSGITEVRVQLAGFEEHHGSVRKHVNGWWLTADLATCIVPVLLCVPLLVDAISGAWVDVDRTYTARLVPRGLVAGVEAYGPRATAQAPAPAAAAPAASVSAVSGMTESERKASARAAYLEGLDLQARGNTAEALARFQLAQRLFDAPTHLLHIAQCLALTGKLVEAQETYELLLHRELPPGAPEPFRLAVEAGKVELTALRPRIPTLRIEVKPSPSTLRNLAVSMNQRPLPNEVLGIARPINPGAYRVTATAWGAPPARPVDVELNEREAKTVELQLGRQVR